MSFTDRVRVFQPLTKQAKLCKNEFRKLSNDTQTLLYADALLQRIHLMTIYNCVQITIGVCIWGNLNIHYANQMSSLEEISSWQYPQTLTEVVSSPLPPPSLFMMTKLTGHNVEVNSHHFSQSKVRNEMSKLRLVPKFDLLSSTKIQGKII